MNNIKNQVVGKVTDQVWRQIWDQVGINSRNKVHTQVRVQIFIRFPNQLPAQLAELLLDLDAIWASICMIHQIHQEDCIDCNIGIWTNYWKQRIISFLFIYCPRIYLWLMSKYKVYNYE